MRYTHVHQSPIGWALEVWDDEKGLVHVEHQAERPTADDKRGLLILYSGKHPLAPCDLCRTVIREFELRSYSGRKLCEECLLVATSSYSWPDLRWLTTDDQ